MPEASGSEATGPAPERSSASEKPAPSRRRFRPLAWLAALAEVSILLLALVGGLAAYLHPHSFWWAQIVAVGLPYWTALLAMATLGLVANRQWGWGLLYAALLVWLLARTVPLGWVTPRSVPAAGDLVLLSFNTPPSGASREVLADGLRLFFEEAQPAVAGLQETVVIEGEGRRWQPHHLDPLTDSLRYALPMPSPPAAAAYVEVDIPLLVRDEQGADGFVVLEQEAYTFMPDQDFPSTMLRTRFRWQGRQGVHYNVHLASYGTDKPWDDGVPFYSLSRGLGYLRQYRDAFRRRARHVEAIRTMLDAETLPLLVSGDFNSTPYNWSFRHLSQGLRDAFRRTGQGWGATYRADLPFVRIDFVLADPAWALVSAEVPSLFLSDHKPLLVRLRWAEAPVEAMPEEAAPTGETVE